MHRPLIACGVLLAAIGSATAAPPPERRCGWLVNPTPANWDLVDRDGTWVLGVQGGYQADGLDAMPDMSTAGWVATNGSYGHGCACLQVIADPRSRRITRVLRATPKPLAQCRRDRSLPKP